MPESSKENAKYIPEMRGEYLSKIQPEKAPGETGKPIEGLTGKSAIEKAEGLTKSQQQKRADAMRDVDSLLGRVAPQEKGTISAGSDTILSSARMDPTQVLPDSSRESTEPFDPAEHQKLFILMNEVFNLKDGLGGMSVAKKGETPKPLTPYYELTKQGIWLSKRGYELFAKKDNKRGDGLLGTVILKQNIIQNPKEMYAKVDEFRGNNRQDKQDAKEADRQRLRNRLR